MGVDAQLKTAARKELSAMQKQLQRDIAGVAKTLNALPKEYRGRVMQDTFEQAAQPLVQSAKQKAPQSKKVHYDYNTKSHGRKTKYYPGNLKKSIRVIKNRNKRDFSVYVGPKVARNAKAKAYGRSDRNVNAFYASFVEFGTSHSAPRPYMRPAYDEAKGRVLLIVTRRFERILRLFAAKRKKR